MIPYRAPVDDYMFIFEHVLKLHRHPARPLGELTLEDVRAVLAAAGAVCEKEVRPANEAADREGSRLTEEGAVTAMGIRRAYRALLDGGWIGLQSGSDHGGAAMPNLIGKAVHEFRSAASMAVAGFAELTEAVVVAVSRFGTPEQKETYLPRLATGHWAGSMHLTEPQAGSDIGLIRTKAVRVADGSYRLTGSKIFISDAEQDLTENVVNLVLARVEGAPQGTRGLSLFIVPRFLPDGQGRPGRRNALRYTGLEDKMGLHGSVTGTMVYEEATGFLVGEENRGLAPLFAMVNETRFGVGLQGLAAASAAHQTALAYARERRQGRPASPRGAAGQGPAPIAAHADVRRMLLKMAGFVQGGRALAAWVALQMDLAERGDGQALAVCNLMTPLIKAFFTDEGFAAADLALQVHGGHGYIRETGVEQFVRDVRVTRIYEGANGIIADDLARRKVCADGGVALATLLDSIEQDIASIAAAGLRGLAGDDLAARVSPAFRDLRTATAALLRLSERSPHHLGAVASDYLRLFGLCMLGWTWLRIVAAAEAADGAGLDGAALRDMQRTGRFYLYWELAETPMLASRLATPEPGFACFDAEDD